MTAESEGFPRVDTDVSLRAERLNTDRELARRVAVADADADEMLRVARERADRLLAAARAAADARLPLSEQTQAAVALLLEHREEEDREVATERARADELLDRDRRERGEKLSMLLVLERHTTDLHLALERSSADKAVASRDDFLAQVSHDLHSLMGAQKIYLALLAKQAEAGEHGPRLGTQVAALLEIEAQMERMISDLVDMVAIEAGHLALVPSRRSAAELLSLAAGVFGPVARERGQALDVTDVPEGVYVMADATRAVQVLGNLLSNAIKFTPQGGKIEIGLQTSDDEVSFFVADSGPGVPPEHAERIFERCVGFGGEAKGLGLGLFIARRLVDAHGGRLWLDSSESGGAVFRFTLPRAR